ncbi:glutaredoxin family protein [Deinococcus sp. D7000]|uniref:glutaredoxin family protein n=1 Tax=Deinococcus radiopugnans TaxID=57497 RepID=UPI00068BF028|nr:glutaredoxin family protein [Deinococcus radiopugnans]QLG11698.1 glutaredoxin family protein [Deinococcus sp. D7000]
MTQLPLLTLYTRVGCHLCEQAQEHLARLEFQVQLLDVDSRPEWRQRYGHDVPVLALEDQVLARGVLSPARLSMIKLQLLRGAAPPSTHHPSGT